MQLEEKKFCFKIHFYNRDKANEIRAHFRSKLYPKAKESGIEIYQNGRIGKWMTVAALKENYWKTDDNGLINMEKTVKRIKGVEAMVDDL